jgi:hypothetical protein
VENVNGVAVHLVSSRVEVGSQVKVTVDWERRWDHMTQVLWWSFAQFTINTSTPVNTRRAARFVSLFPFSFY